MPTTPAEQMASTNLDKNAQSWILGSRWLRSFGNSVLIATCLLVVLMIPPAYLSATNETVSYFTNPDSVCVCVCVCRCLCFNVGFGAARVCVCVYLCVL
jgi:hypothetical protein